jgi:hypothetical protein
MSDRYYASKAAPPWRQPCNCAAYLFPHRAFSGKCRAPLDWSLLSVRDPRDEERAEFNATEARTINADR